MEYKVINLTGHEVHELRSDVVYPTNGPALRIKSKCTSHGTMNGTTIESVSFDDSIELPPRKEGVIYLVSQLTLNAIPADRTDILAPKQVVKFKEGPRKGEVKGCIGLRRKEN